MKSLTLLILSAALAPAFFLMGRGARLESWPVVACAAAVLALLYGAARYFLEN